MGNIVINRSTQVWVIQTNCFEGISKCTCLGGRQHEEDKSRRGHAQTNRGFVGKPSLEKDKIMCFRYATKC